jgi:hypothetical protein
VIARAIYAGRSIPELKDMNKEKVVDTLKRCWSKRTGSKWARDNPAQGQCSVTALVIQDHFGGQLLKTKVDGLWHFYNKIDGIVYDFTDSQFTEPILYENEPASREEALSDTSQERYVQLNREFATLWSSNQGVGQEQGGNKI